MRFYTNVQMIGNQFLVRGVEGGRRFETRDEFFPTLFVKSKKKTKSPTKKHASNDAKATLNNSAAVQHQAPIQTEADPVLADDSDAGR